MNPLNFEPYKLANRIGDGRHPYLGDDGVFLPDGTPLLRRSRYGDWEPRPLEALAKALAPHDDDIDVMAWRCRRLAAIADHLNKGDKVLAIISLLHLRLRGTPTLENRWLSKYNYNPAERRRDDGTRFSSEWATDGSGTTVANAGEPDGTKTGLSPEKRRFFQVMYPPVHAMANRLNINEDWVLGLSAQESGWLGVHAVNLNNPYGLTNAGGKNLEFSSIQSATDYWESHFGNTVRNATSENDFINRLRNTPNGAYNNSDSWIKGVKGCIDGVQQRKPLWIKENSR